MPNNSGTLSLDIDCTENPAALNEAYLANKFTQSLSFSIAGSCYGDITVPRNEEEPLIQVHGQVIFITGVDDSAALIDNDLTGNINLWATFGGGLYLRDLSIVTSGVIPVAYSRNGHGSVTNVSINRAEGDAAHCLVPKSPCCGRRGKSTDRPSNERTHSNEEIR